MLPATVEDNHTRWVESRSPQTWFAPSPSFLNTQSHTAVQSRFHSDSFYNSLSPEPYNSPAPAEITPPEPSQLAAQSPQGCHEAIPLHGSPGTSSTLTRSLHEPDSPLDSPRPPLSKTKIDELLEMGTAWAFLILYTHDSLKTFSSEHGFHVFECPSCTLPVKTSIVSTISLKNIGQFTPLANHYRQKQCRAALQRKEKNSASCLLLQGPSIASIPFTPSTYLSPLVLDDSLRVLDTLVQSQISSSQSSADGDNLIFPSGPIFGPPSFPCHGLPFQWRLPEDANMQMLLPWNRTLSGHYDELSFTLNVLDAQSYARSPYCDRIRQSGTPCCPPCSGLEVEIVQLGKTWPEYQPGTRRSLQNMVQLSQSIDRREQEIKKWKLKSLNDQRTIGRKLETIESHSALVMALSQSDLPWLRQLMTTLLNNGAGINTILRKIEEAVENGYKPRNYSKDAYDLALLVYRLGGANLLYALNQRLAIPSLRSVIRNHFTLVTISPTIGPITLDVISANIRTVIIEPRAAAGRTALRGLSLLTDEVALEECAVYFPSANGVGGLCWKHSHAVDPILNTIESATHIATKLTSGEVHLGKEMSVIAAHCFGEDDTYPILAAPSCKAEDHNDWEKLIESVIESWYMNDAHKTVGPLWSFATDGDATRRKAGHKVFMKSKLDTSSPLYGILSALPGLNLYTGIHDTTLDFDYKHIIKRFCTMLRSTHGIMLNNGRRVNAKFLHRYLTWLDDCDDAKAQKLIYPDDPQDVPRAVEFIRAIIRLGNIDPTQSPHTPSGSISDVNAVVDFEALSILGQLLHHLLEPFINITLSLTEQVVHLSTFAHLLFSLYHAHRRMFMPNQLYYDAQTMVKNAIFCIAKQQRLDASFPFYLPDVGDDAIELLFAFLRMCGGHNSAINYKQAIDRLRAARDIGSIYARNPDLSHGHRRLNLSRSEHVDHINRDMWKGDLISRGCNIPTAWIQGQNVAVNILSSSSLDPTDYDFNILFTNSDVDLLSVFGGGRYPGINEGDEHEDPSAISRASVATAQEVVPAQEEQIRDTTQRDSEDGNEDSVGDVRSFEDELEDELNMADSPGSESEQPVTNVDSASSPPLPSGPGVRPLDYLLVDGKWVHKSTICRILFNGNFTPKSHDRLLRVRGFTSVNRNMTTSAAASASESLSSFTVGNPYLTFVRLRDNSTHVALFRSTAIHENGLSRSDINTDTLLAPTGKVKVTGQMLSLLPSESNPPSQPDDDYLWIWNGAYLKSISPLPGSAVSTQKVVELTTLGPLLTFVNPSVVTAADHLPINQLSEVNSRGITWAVSNDTLDMAVTKLWNQLTESKLAVTNITVLQSTDSGFPYRSRNDFHAFPCEEARVALSAGNGNSTKVICRLCQKPTADLRSHVGGHVLRASRGVEEEGLNSSVGDLLPCGFCGRSGHLDCVIKLKTTKKGKEIDVRCVHRVDIKYGYAERGSVSRPCRNVPVVCPLCIHRDRQTSFKDAVWRYNMEQHLNFFHPEYAHPGKHMGLPLPYDVYELMSLTPAEEKKAGVPSRPPFTLIAEKENDKGTSNARNCSVGSKRSLAAEAGASSGAKRARK